MKKFILSTLLLASAMTLVSAQEARGTERGGAGNPPVKKMVANAVRPVMASSTPQMMPEGIPFFGDKAIDDKIKALVKERDEKIKAVHEEFQKKLKELIGERKDLRASTTDMRERLRNASGTPPREDGERRPMNASGTDMRRPEGPSMDRLNRPAPRGENKGENQGFFKRFLQSFLGGNVNEAQAESQ